MNDKLLLETIITALKEKHDFTTSNLDGHFFVGADIVFTNANEHPTKFRITIIQHEQEKNFT